MRLLLIPALAVLAAPFTSAGAQPAGASLYPPEFNTPIPLYDVLGSFGRRITTDVPRAQAFFDQGIRLIYSFSLQEAARSFKEAQKLDSTCAMCWFGEAWAWGPYLNGRMGAAAAPRAYLAIRKAMQLRGRSTPVERALIEAMSVRYDSTLVAADRARLDTAYASAMEKVYSRYRNDGDVGTLYAEALMLLNTARGTYRNEQPHVQRFHNILEATLKRDIRHPGACHLYIHATEATERPDKAEACALHLGSMIPGASHINHMPSHTYNRVGRWGDAVRANLDAWHTDLKASAGKGVAIYATHNLLMLLYSASYDGQGAIATQAAKDFVKISPGATQHRVLTLVRFGRFDEVLEVQTAPTGGGGRVLWDFGRGYAHLKRGSADSAKFYLERVEGATRDGNARQNAVPNVVRGILKAELLRSEGKLDEAITVLDSAAATEDDIPYAEPEALPFAVRHWLGAMLLEAKRFEDAERTYRDDLVKHPRNGWSLYGLAEALDAQGKNAEAERVRGELRESWSRSDTWLRGSRF